jgi:uncharacterized protein (TIGR02001 family)
LPRCLLRAAAALGLTVLAAVLRPAPAAAQIALGETGLTLTATPALTTDYVFRGISQTRSRPAIQFTGDLAHSSGVYIGAFASNVAFAGTDARQEIDALFGYRFELLTVNWDLGGIYYSYPGYDRQPGQLRLDYFEFALRGTREIGPVKVLGAFHYSPDFQGEARNGFYLEGGVDVTLPFEFTASGRLAYQWIDRNRNFGAPDYLWYSIGVSRPLPFGFTAALAWYDTNISQSDCFAGAKVCDGRVVFTLSRTF